MANKKQSLAIEAIRKQIQLIAFDANLFDRGIATYPYAEACSKKRKALQEALDNLLPGSGVRKSALDP